MRLTAFAFALVLCIVPAAAQDIDLGYSDKATAECVAGAYLASDMKACIGLSSDKCQSDNGFATVVISGCLSQEVEWWDNRLNIQYQQARARAKQNDADNGDYAPSQDEALRDMQRAWIPFRDATCAFEASLWGGGTGAGPAYVSCLLQMTAEQAITLEYAGFN